MQNQPTEVSTDELSRAQRSVTGRLKRLRKMSLGRRSWLNENSVKSPIAKIGCFDTEIDEMEKILKNMDSRLNRAKVIIPAE